MKTKIKELVRIVLMLTGIGLANGAWAYSVGDMVEWSNTNTASAVYTTLPAINECHFDFKIPASEGLPAGSVVEIKSITLASLNGGSFVRENSTNFNSDPGFLNLNGVKSSSVNGVTFVSDNYTGTFTDKIQSSTTQEDYALKYEFSNCQIAVDRNYPAATGSSKGAVGYGVACLHPNGNCIYGSSTDRAGVRYVKTGDANSVLSTSTATTKTGESGYYPVYIVKAQVVSVYNAKSPDFDYNAVVGSAYATDYSGKWGTSTPSGNYYRVGSNCNDLVIEYSAANSPNWGMAAKDSAFSFITYADVSQTQSSGKIVLFAFGASSGNNTCVLYREGAYIKLGYYQNGSTLLGTAAQVALPSSGYHLIAGVCDPTKGTLKLYVGKNDGTLDSATGGTATEQTVTMNAGFQICSIYHGKGGFTQCNNLALAKILGFDRALSDEVIASFLTDFPATDGTQITADISPSISGKTLTVYASSAVDNQYLGITSGTLTIPAGNTVTVPQMRVMNTQNVTINIAGTVNVTSTMDSIAKGSTPFDIKDAYKGIIFGGAEGTGNYNTGTYNITGTLNAPNTYLQTNYKGDEQYINIKDGGLVSVKGIYDGGVMSFSVPTICISGGGTLEVGEIVTLAAPAFPCYREFGDGTYKVLSTGTENRATTFNAVAGKYTTLDPTGNVLTIPATADTTVDGSKTTRAAVNGSGDIKVASSVSGGKVKFNSLTTDYTGNITVAANSTMELVAGAYAGTITVETGGTLEINPGSGVDYTCSATITGAGSVAIKSGNVTLATAPTVTSAISVDSGATLILPTGTVAGVSGSGELNIPNNVVVTVTTANAITVGSLTGTGTLLMSGIGPGSSNPTLQNLLKNGNWDGTFAIANVTRTDSNGLKAMDLHLWGNAGSKLKLIGVKGYFNKTTTAEQVAAQPELVLENGTGDYAYGYKVDDGWSYTISSNRNDANYAIIRKLSGTGKLLDDCNPSQLYVINDASDFSGSIEQGTRGSPYGKTFVFSPSITPSTLPGNGTTTSFDGTKATAGTIDVRSDATIAMANGSTWQSQNGIRIAGNVTLKGSATLSSATTFVDGAKLVYEAGSVLNASAITLPASGTVTLDVTALTIPSAGYTLISGVTFTAADCDKFSITAGSGEYYALVPEGTALKIYPNGASATVNGVTTKYSKFSDAFMAYMGSFDVTAYATPLADSPSYSDAELLSVYAALDSDGNYYKATVKIGTKGYKSLARAIELATDEDTVTLVRNNEESNVGLSGKTITLAEGDYTFNGSFAGNGTVVLGSPLKSADPARWAAGWTGIVELKGITTVITDFDFADYGNANSTVRANNVLVRMNTETSGEYGAVKEINIASGGLKFDKDVAINEKTFTFSAKLTGTGPLRIGTPGGDGSHATKANVTKYVFKGDLSEFTGAVDYNDLASYRAAIVFADADDEIPTPTDWGQIIVTDDVTLKSSGTLNGAGGFIVKGTIELQSGGAISTGGDKIAGDGTIVLTDGSQTAIDASKLSTTAGKKWTGTVWLKNLSNFTIDPATYGNSDSVIKFTGVSGRIEAGTTCSPAVELEDDGETKALTLNSYSTTSSSTITFNEFKGSGTFVTVGGTANAYPRTNFRILKWDDFEGSLDVDRGRAIFGEDTISTDDWRYIYISADADVTIAAGKAFTATEGLRVYGSLTVPALSSLSGTIAGGGTITCQALHASDYTPSFGTWTGTVVLPTPLDSINANGENRIFFNSYGITGSTVKVGEIKAGWLQIETINPTVEVVTKFALTAFSPQGRPYTFTALKGGGEFSVSCPAESVANYASWGSDHSAYYLVKDVSNFTGSMTVSNCGIAIGDSKPDYKTPGGKIIVNSGKSATVAAGKTWTAGTNLKVDGSIAVASDGALSGTIEGSGTITYAAVPSALTFGTWTGTVELPSFYAGGAKLDNYGKSGSTITVNGISGGWLDYTTAGSPNTSRHQATLDLRGAVNITAVSGYDYIFDHIKGDGSFSIASNNETMPNSITITKLETAGDAAGVAVNNNTTTTLTVGTLALTTEPASGTKILSTGGTGTVTLSAVTVGGAAATFGVKKGDDGYYAGYASTTTGEGGGAVTTVDASSEVSEVTVAVPASYSGKVVIPANVKKLTITGETVSAANIGLKAPYAGNADNIYYGIVNIGEGNVVLLNGEATVGGVKVTPEIKTGDAENPPMAMSGSAPAFSAKAIPGLWYAVKAASSEADLGDKFKYGTPVQATGDTVNIEAPTFPGTVTYYRLSAGMNQDDVTRYIVSTNRLAVRPTTDGLFAYGENSTTTTAAHDCYRIPAIASTWLPGDAGDPLQAIVMGIYDARTSYWDLGQRMNKTTNERQWNNNEHHFAGIDIAGNYSLDGGASWSAAQIMIDVPNAFDPATGTDNRNSTNGISKDYDIGDPAIVYVPETKKFLMMGITGGGNSSVSNITANAMGADLAIYECAASSVANGAPNWQKVTGFTKEGVIALLKAKDDTLTFDYPPNGYSFDYDSTRAWTRETVYFLSILQGPGNALVTREDCGSIKAGTIVFPMQYCAKKRKTDGNHVGISYTFALYSTDNGATWNVTSVCKDEAAYGSECCIAQLDDGSLLMEVRPPNASTKRAFFRSTDFNTWTKACELVESAGPAEGSILRIGAKDGKSVYACSFTTGATRADLQLFIGTDYTSDEDVANVAKGINWTTTPFCTIWKGDTGTASTGTGVDTVVYGYSSLVMLDETTLGVLLEAHGHIYFTKIDVSSALK